MTFAATVVWLPAIGSIILIIIGLAAAIGYTRVQVGKTWRESAEGWREENDANKARADRLADDLKNTVAELKNAQARTDITLVLGLLQEQHKEATAILTRIADESAARNGHIASTLAKSNERVEEHHGETVKALARIADEAEARDGDIAKIVSETLKTVEELRRT